jgi:nucleoside 2-deoxyribosyltransferase
MGITPKIDSDAVPRLRALTKPSFQERVEQYLLAAGAKSPRLDQLFNPGTDDLIGISYSDDARELAVITQYLQEQGLMTELLSVGEAKRRLTAKGYMTADELRARRAASTQAFVAMAFTNEMKRMYQQAIEPAIREAGFSPMVISEKEHANKIDDEIIAEIRRSAFLVADFTEHRQNVYFETGFAIGLARHVVWTCRKDQIKDLHFDIRQYNCVDWVDAADLARRLQLRIEGSFGRGPLVP